MKLYVPAVVMRIAWPVVEDPVNVLFSNRTGVVTEHHRFPAVTPVTLMVLFLMRVLVLLVRLSFVAGTPEIVQTSRVQPDASIDEQLEKVIPENVMTLRKVTTAPTTTNPEKSHVAAFVAAELISQ